MPQITAAEVQQDLHRQRRNFNGEVLSRLVLNGLNFQKLAMYEATLNETQLVGADLKRADLRHADLEFANLKGADLTETRLDYANLEGANLTGANLTNTRLNRVAGNGREIKTSRFLGIRVCWTSTSVWVNEEEIKIKPCLGVPWYKETKRDKLVQELFHNLITQLVLADPAVPHAGDPAFKS